MKLNMFNVGFGDCFIIKSESTNFLVDCGTIKFNYRMFKSFSEFVDYINQYELTRNKKNIGLITHFHEDHYGGFKLLKNKGEKDIFNKIYIPYISYDKKTKKYVIFEKELLITKLQLDKQKKK